MFNSEKFPFTILSIHKLYLSASERYSPPRSHNALIFRLYGRAELSHDDNKVLLNKNDVTFIPANYDYTIRSENEEIIAVHFTIDSGAQYPFSFLSAHRPELFSALFEEMLSVWKTMPLGYQYKIDSLFSSILEKIEIQTKTEICSPLYVNVYRAVDYMHKHFSKHDFSIDHLAKQFGYCPSYFRRIFKKATGVAPQDYLSELRLSYADTLLSSGYYTVKEVAFACGFFDPKYFSTAYKKKRNKSPSKA